jgi:hypothetical protein
MAVPFSAVLQYISIEILEHSGYHCIARNGGSASSEITIADIESCLGELEGLAKTYETFSASVISSFLESVSEATKQASAFEALLHAQWTAHASTGRVLTQDRDITAWKLYSKRITEFKVFVY